jgi:hypothetical protein
MGRLFKWSAIAPPARRLCELIYATWNPCYSMLSFATAAFSAQLISKPRMSLPVRDPLMKYVLMIVFGFDV